MSGGALARARVKPQLKNNLFLFDVWRCVWTWTVEQWTGTRIWKWYKSQCVATTVDSIFGVPHSQAVTTTRKGHFSQFKQRRKCCRCTNKNSLNIWYENERSLFSHHRKNNRYGLRRCRHTEHCLAVYIRYICFSPVRTGFTSRFHFQRQTQASERAERVWMCGLNRKIRSNRRERKKIEPNKSICNFFFCFFSSGYFKIRMQRQLNAFGRSCYPVRICLNRKKTMENLFHVAKSNKSVESRSTDAGCVSISVMCIV